MSPGFPGGSVVKNPPAHAGDTGLIPGSGRSHGGGNGNPLHYFCLENPTDKGAWQLQSMGLQESEMTERVLCPLLQKVSLDQIQAELDTPLPHSRRPLSFPRVL